MKRPTKSSDGGTRVRFIMLEAESESGDLTQIAAAIQNALRPKGNAEPRTVYLEDRSTSAEEPAVEPLASEEDGLHESVRKRERVSPQKRSFPTPSVVDVQWEVAPTVEDFMKEHPPKTVADQFLGAVAWLKEAGGKDAASVDEVYTVFRKLGWSTNIKDFSQPLRDLKGRQWVAGSAKEGFSINHLGLDRVKNFGKSK